jgi:hypothetical protein
MTYEIDPALVRSMASRYDAAVAPLAHHDLPTTRVAADTFGHVELAAWFAAVADQVDEAGRALHDAVTTMATNLRVVAKDAETADDDAAARFTPPPAFAPPPGDIATLLDPTRPPPPVQSRYGGFL